MNRYLGYIAISYFITIFANIFVLDIERDHSAIRVYRLPVSILRNINM